MDADTPLVIHSISVMLSDKVIFVVWNTDLNSLSYFPRIEKLVTNKVSISQTNTPTNSLTMETEHNSLKKTEKQTKPD